MSRAMKAHVSKVEISQMCRSPLNQPERSPSYLFTLPRQGSVGTSSFFFISRAAEPFLLIQGLSLARHGIQAAQALSAGAVTAATNSPGTAPGPTPVTHVESHPPRGLRASTTFHHTLSPLSFLPPSTEGRKCCLKHCL